MFSAEKRRFSIPTNKQKDSAAATSIDQGIESDFSSLGDSTQPPVKRPCLSNRQVSFSQGTRNSFDLAELASSSSGYGSLLSSNSTLSPSKSATRKRKSDGSDENALYEFVSPSKSRKTNPSGLNCAKKILKDKCSSENIILSSTPKKVWGKSKSLHPGKFGSFDDEKFSILPKATEEEASFDFGESIDLTTSITENHQDIPRNLEQLLQKPINVEAIAKPPQTPQETLAHSTSNLSTASSGRSRWYNGRLKLDILGKLHWEKNLALEKILSHVDDLDLLSLSHVSKDYNLMIKSSKIFEPKRQNYLKEYRKVKENLTGKNVTLPVTLRKAEKRKAKFGDVNLNHSMQLRPKIVTPPVSPSRRKFVDNQKVKF